MTPPQLKARLISILVGIFACQVLFMGYGVLNCERLNRCDTAGQRIEDVFNVMIATTLSLLVGSSTK
jgi:hypothetical protein